MQNMIDGRFFDDVIPLCFDASEFTYRGNEEKEPFALYVGRLVPKKGLVIACKAAAAAGIPLKVIGHGDPALVTDGAEYLGTPGMEERNEWMSRASMLIAPTTYVEPFGSTVVEAQMAGTPAITTDFGGFVETVEQGRTGFRCTYMQELVDATGVDMAALLAALDLPPGTDPHPALRELVAAGLLGEVDEVRSAVAKLQ
jgi:glycosyltransferase involved in cell wall biosynthesis